MADTRQLKHPTTRFAVQSRTDEDGGPFSLEGRPSQAERLVALVAGEVDLFHTPGGEGYATINVGEHRETWALRSRPLRRWLLHSFYEHTQRAPSGRAVTEALQLLDARAQFGGTEHDVYTRVAPGASGGVWLDLGTADWNAVEVAPAGWRVVDAPPVKFRRARGLLPLPAPERDGRLDELRRFLPLRSDDDWRLVVAWITAAMRPRGPYPVLCLHGEQGSGKSTAARLLRGLVDPSSAPLRSEPHGVRDLMISASNSWVLALDNLSRLQPWLSDALCRLSTGGGFATRQLFSDGDETIFDAMRPVILTGIEEVAVRGDLVERCLVVELPPIEAEARLEERRYWEEVERVLPQVLGAILDAASGALRKLAELRLERLPRMADFAAWGVAVERALGWPDGSFLAAYESSMARSNRLSLEGDPVAEALLAEMAAAGSWTGRAAELLDVLGAQVGQDVRRDRERWPSTARALSGRLRRLAPALRSAGLRVEMPTQEGRQGRERDRVIRVHKAPALPSAPSTSSASVPSTGIAAVDAVGVDDVDGVAGP
jgi:energy-coupling factor transporter ATP-binding protein EcfA2